MTGIPDDAVEAPRDLMAELKKSLTETRAGLAAARPRLTDACDALRAAEAAPTQSHQPTPERRPTATTGASNDVPQQNPNPTDTTQED